MIVLDIPCLFERPRHLVFAFMTGLSTAAGISARCYVDGPVTVLCGGAGSGAKA